MFEQVLRRPALPNCSLGPDLAAPAAPAWPLERRASPAGRLFEQVLRREARPKRPFGSAAAVTAAFYACAAAFVVWAERQPRVYDRQDVEIKFVQLRPPPRAPPRSPVMPASRTPAPPAASLKPALVTARPTTVLVQAIVAPTVIPESRPPEQDPGAAPALGAGDGEGLDYEVPAVPGGIVNPVVDAAVAAEIALVTDPGAGRAPEFDARMTPPEFVAGPSPQYTQKALEREVEGVMEVRCRVTIDGRVRDCRVVRSLPFMDRAVIDALERRRYRPATLGGRPVEVYYRFRIPLRLSD